MILILFYGYSIGSVAVAGYPQSAAYLIYRSIPGPLLKKGFDRPDHPNSEGLASHNALEKRWLQVGFQRAPLVPMLSAIIENNAHEVLRLWPAIDAAFAHQRPDGSFVQARIVDGKPTDHNGDATSAAFFILQLGETILVLKSSPMEQQFRQRISALTPQVNLAVQNLAKPTQLDNMRRSDAHTLNRLIGDAGALILGGILAKERNGLSAGQTLLHEALAQQRSDGIFPEASGGDTGYQADSILDLAEVAVFYQTPEIMQALKKGVQWELRHISTSGCVSVRKNTRTGLKQELYFGKPKGINYPEVVRALAIYAALAHDPQAFQIALAVANRHP